MKTQQKVISKVQRPLIVIGVIISIPKVVSYSSARTGLST